MMTAKNVSVSVNVIRHPPFWQEPSGRKTFKSPCPELRLVPENKLRSGKESAACVSTQRLLACHCWHCLQHTIKIDKLQQNRPQSFKTAAGGSLFAYFLFVFCSKNHASFFLSRSLVYSALVALSTARTMTPTSAKMAVHILAMPSAPRTRQTPLTPSAKTMFW